MEEGEGGGVEEGEGGGVEEGEGGGVEEGEGGEGKGVEEGEGRRERKRDDKPKRIPTTIKIWNTMSMVMLHVPRCSTRIIHACLNRYVF